MAAGVDPASLHPFHPLPDPAHLKDESGGMTRLIQVEQHSGGRSTQAELPRRAGASSISGGRYNFGRIRALTPARAKWWWSPPSVITNSVRPRSGSGRHSGPALRPPEIWPARPAGPVKALPELTSSRSSAPPNRSTTRLSGSRGRSARSPLSTPEPDSRLPPAA